ncbi:MAG TPA: enoyl-CoA hydratase/isomerase family protein, partial [Polymorphobacter sp.]|nr:enoyl-CoA hydratase/isomerase family protein [Polymorphobacter sp.]
MEPLVKREDFDGWTQLTLNRPDKLNSLTVGVFAELRAHVEALATDASVGCVVLRGAGKCFSAGHDLGDIAEGEKVPSRGWHSETLRMMEMLPQPVVAAVHGHCYTGALEVALACDFIVAADDARFGDTHAKWALTPIWGMSQRLPRRVGAASAKRLMF